MNFKSDKRNLFISLILGSALLFGLSVFINLVPSNPLLGKNAMSQLAPQGFAFYSKSPSDDVLMIHESSPQINLPNASPHNIFGLSRHGRSQMIELGSIETDFPNSEWEPCKSEEECVEIANEQDPTIIDEEFKHLEHGEYILYYREPLNWYWREYEETSSFNARVIKVKII
ncbi:SdpA family antimicrobial peptide system protein [Halobacillus litoralis]|uniref:SdpA family antimicrobial peptide system protein n=1 Tax=Halobacillus litoralis TaxID=45668 RepID=UPI001CD5A0DB|nr:SdpA family antimicrobial peptide system protein [Halobacillus litoralis]MCA0970897.1 SdpA family antimicrobial peptide system protein [Halobacillus litoralis]